MANFNIPNVEAALLGRNKMDSSLVYTIISDEFNHCLFSDAEMENKEAIEAINVKFVVHGNRSYVFSKRLMGIIYVTSQGVYIISIIERNISEKKIEKLTI